jgi:hypothetical protein
MVQTHRKVNMQAHTKSENNQIIEHPQVIHSNL